MATRTRFNGSSVRVPWKNTIDTPEGFGDQYSRLLGALFDAASFPLTNVGGTEDDVTADLEYELSGGTLVDGMMFSLTWADSNTGPMTLAINGGAPVSVLDSSGGAMISGGVWSGLRSVIEYIGGSFRIVSDRNSGQSPDPYFTQITASTTWNKPDGYADDAVVFIEAWGGGASGGKSPGGGAPAYGGGGGGGYVPVRLRYADVPSSLSIVIGAGGAARSTAGNGLAGGATTVGTILTAPGGQANNNSGGPGGRPGGLVGTVFAGGDGGPDDTPGGNSIYGGGGGGGGESGSGQPLKPGGTSLFGGNGGSGGRFTDINGTAGSAPGGGGGGIYLSGSSGAGARGEVRIWIWN